MSIISTKQKATRSDYRNFHVALDSLMKSSFEDTNYRLAKAADLDQALIQKVRSGERAPTPMFIGAIVHALEDRQQGDALIEAYLADVKRQILECRPRRRG